jgi:hypothetical protein
MVLIEELNESKPLKKCRDNNHGIEIERMTPAREQGARYNLIIACMVSGIKTAGTLSGHVYGTGEPDSRC